MSGSNLKISFVCVLGIIAIAENGMLDRMSQRDAQQVAAVAAQEKQQQQHQQEEKQRETAAQQTAQDAATAHAQYLARYTDTDFARKPRTTTIAVVAASENATWNSAVNTALVNRFKNKTVQLLPSFFKPAFVSDGLLNDTFADSSDLFNRLELSKSLDAVLLARERVQYAPNPSLDNVLTATMELDIETRSIGSQGKNMTWTFTTAGAGFKQADARAMAEERLIKQIMNDTNMALSQSSPNQ